MHFGLVILIPCYNEFKRLQTDEFYSFVSNHSDTALVFCNDGSTDGTLVQLQKMQETFPQNIFISNSDTNRGKAEAVRLGYNYSVYNLQFHKIGYLDADLSTSLQELMHISTFIQDEVHFSFGSRISKIDNIIRRKFYRHIIGRIVATFISNALGIAVYDTQCGAKVFSASAAAVAFEHPFSSRWLFDVEIFYRLIGLYGRDHMRVNCREIPLQKWVDVAESKVSFSYGFKLWYDLFLIYKKYDAKIK